MRESDDRVSTLDHLEDVIVAQILPTLRALVPDDARQWKTVEDYLHTPCYSLEMNLDPANTHAEARVVDGPKIKPAHEMRTFPIS